MNKITTETKTKNQYDIIWNVKMFYMLVGNRDRY